MRAAKLTGARQFKEEEIQICVKTIAVKQNMRHKQPSERPVTLPTA